MGERSADGSIKRATRIDYAQGDGGKRRLAATEWLVIISLASSLLAIAMAWCGVFLFYWLEWSNGLLTHLGLGAVLAASAVVAGLEGQRRASRESKRAWSWAALAAAAFGVMALLFQMIQSYRA